MLLSVVILFYGLTSSVLCTGIIYTENCKPPLGANNSGVTTPGYDSLLPIERCCPLCEECKGFGGECILKWVRELYPQCCDFHPVEPCRDYSCECCIVCSNDKCSPCVQTGGECRTECRANELEDKDNVCGYHNNGTGCKCCKKCHSTHECSDAQGICVTNPNDCPQGTYASTGCCGGCYCCKPVQEVVPGSHCAKTTGCYCADDQECAFGFYASFGECTMTVFNEGLETIVQGYGCLPVQQGAPHGRIDNFRTKRAPLHKQQITRKHPRQL